MSAIREAVCVSYQAGSDWAVLVVAAREGADRRIVPVIWASEDASPFAECAQLALWKKTDQVWVLRNKNLTLQQKENQLAEAVALRVADVGKQFTLLNYSKNPGVISYAVKKVLSQFESLPNFAMSEAPAYRWLVEKNEAAARVHFYLRYLALGDSGSIPALTELTHEEKAQREEDWLLKGIPPPPPILKAGQKAKNGMVLNPRRKV
jgi:hypothetical protein